MADHNARGGAAGSTVQYPHADVLGDVVQPYVHTYIHTQS